MSENVRATHSMSLELVRDLSAKQKAAALAAGAAGAVKSPGGAPGVAGAVKHPGGVTQQFDFSRDAVASAGFPAAAAAAAVVVAPSTTTNTTPSKFSWPAAAAGTTTTATVGVTTKPSSGDESAVAKGGWADVDWSHSQLHVLHQQPEHELHQIINSSPRCT